ncbi:MAG: succinylglutamate desuccinylase/aspartoacylase family protein [Cyclobacteriaceae bacterium]
MTSVKINREKQYQGVTRVLVDIDSGIPGPLILAVGGIHGNELAGIIAIHQVADRLENHNIQIKGRFLGLTGNINAVRERQRYIDKDLNRIFPRSRSKCITYCGAVSEVNELDEFIQLIDDNVEADQEVFYVDCHTTSSETAPYLSVNEYDKSIELADGFPLATVVGLQKVLPGCCAEYLNLRGFHGFTAEGGQHDDFASIENLEAIIWMMFCHTGAVDRKTGSECFPHHYQLLSKNIIEGKKKFELIYHYRIAENEQFSMKPGYINFQRIEKGEWLASNQHSKIHSPYDCRILMPLYQEQGDDGFFLLQENIS